MAFIGILRPCAIGKTVPGHKVAVIDHQGREVPPGTAGKPDPMRTEIVKAYVVLKPDQNPTHALAGDIQDWVKNQLSAHKCPREVEFVSHLPLTTIGKVIRRELRERAITEARTAIGRRSLAWQRPCDGVLRRFRKYA